MKISDEVRAAATKLRETARQATSGRWSLLISQIVGVYDEATHISTDVAFTNGNTANARWIALASPALAGPQADLLDAVADEMDKGNAVENPASRQVHPTHYLFGLLAPSPAWTAALATARVINGGDR